MNNIDFCYWLQGYFELTEVRQGKDVESLAHVQLKTMRDHILLVKNFEPLSPFLAWLDGFLEAWIIAPTMNWHEATRRVRKRLTDVFGKRTPNRKFESLEITESGPLSQEELQRVCERIINPGETCSNVLPNLHDLYNQGSKGGLILGRPAVQKFCGDLNDD